MKSNRELGIVVYGATGFTCRLVAEYLNNQYGVNGEVVWAMAGRSLSKLEQVRDEMSISADVPLVVADHPFEVPLVSAVVVGVQKVLCKECLVLAA